MTIHQDLCSIKIRDRLQALTPVELNIEDDSALHAGHAGAASGGGHYRIQIVAEAFAGLSRLARHRRIYALLDDMMRSEIHALSIDARTPDELFPT